MCGTSDTPRHARKRSKNNKSIQQPVGLENQNNVCYLNSTLQVAGATNLLVNEVQKHSRQDCNKCKTRQFCLTRELKQHFRQVVAKPRQPHNVLSLQRNLTSISRGFKLGKQQDGMECYTGLINTLCEQNTKLKSIFKGKHQSQVICDVSGHRSSHLEDFTDIAVDVHNSKGKYDIVTCLRKFVQPDVIDEYKCKQCRRFVTAKKSLIVKKAPEILTLHLKRNDPFRNNAKNNKFVNYPEMLDLSEFMTSKPSKPIVYRLYSVMIHKGAFSNSGHYFTFVKMGGRWYKTDDTKVRQVDASIVLQQNGAYVLFYQQVKKEASPRKDSTISVNKALFMEKCTQKDSGQVQNVKKGAIVGEIPQVVDVKVVEPCVTKVTDVKLDKPEAIRVKCEYVASQATIKTEVGGSRCESNVKTSVYYYSACERNGVDVSKTSDCIEKVLRDVPFKNTSYPKCVPEVTFKQGYQVELKARTKLYNQSPQSTTKSTSILSKAGTSFSAQKPKMSFPPMSIMTNPQKSGFSEIDDSQGFCEKCQCFDADKAYPIDAQITFVRDKQGIKRKAGFVYDCLYPLKVARVNNTRWI